MVEFFCNIPSLKSLTDAPIITAWNSYQLMNLMRGKEGEQLQLIINHMGELSAIAQRLHGPITSIDRLLQSFQKLYLLTSNVLERPGHIRAQGLLKVGQKNLFIRRNNAHLVEMSPLCVLDFYVHESCQRQGLGHMMFEFMLEQEKKRPCQLGYDKPSDKLLAFMNKHYKLRSYNSQANQFVVYNDYFEDAENHRVREKENCQKEPNRVPDIGTTPRKEKVLHGRQANPQAGDAEQPWNPQIGSRPDCRRLATADSRPSVTSLPQPSFHRGGGNNWQLKQDESEKLPSFHTPDTRHSPRSPTKAVSLPLKDAYRQELNEQGKIFQTRKLSNSQSGEPRKWHDTHRAALKTCNNLQEHDNLTPLYSIIGEEERLKIQSLCPPSLAQKMNYTNRTRCHQDLKPLRPQPMGRSSTKQISKNPSKESPPTYPFWTEAKELSSAHHRQERNPVDNRRSRACC